MSRHTGALTVSRAMQRILQMSCDWWSSLLDQVALLRVLLITWTMLWDGSRGLWRDATNVPSMPQVCGQNKVPWYFSIHSYKYKPDSKMSIACLCSSDLISEEELQVLADLTGCSAIQRAPSCKTTPNLNMFRTASSVCNNRWGDCFELQPRKINKWQTF